MLYETICVLIALSVLGRSFKRGCAICPQGIFEGFSPRMLEEYFPTSVLVLVERVSSRASPCTQKVINLAHVGLDMVGLVDGLHDVALEDQR